LTLQESDILEFQRLQREEMRADREQRESIDNSVALLEAEIKSKESLLPTLNDHTEAGREKKGFGV
jgi:hypothetical protein